MVVPNHLHNQILWDKDFMGALGPSNANLVGRFGNRQ